MKRLWMIGLVGLLLVSSCGTREKPLPADEAEAFAAQVDAMSENLLVALNNHDYAAFTRDMDATMKQASTEPEFDELYETISGQFGKYVSREVTRVTEHGQFRAVWYDVRFEKKEHVTVKVVYDAAEDPPLISGLWFY